jgi:polyhydroxybutyrate depolymerase
MSGRIAAIAAVGGQSVTGPCKPARAVPVLHIHGTADQCAVYAGSDKCGGCFADTVAALTGRAPKDTEGMQWACDPVPQSLADRAALYGCTAGPAVVHKDGPLKCERWAGCHNRAVVKLCHIDGAGHAWPGGAEPGVCQTRPDGRFCQNWRARTGASVPGLRAAAIVVDFFQSVK